MRRNESGTWPHVGRLHTIRSMDHEDRRRKRSIDPLIALHYQLAHTRTDADLDAVVVADASGVVVAGAGSWAACEELAAYAPILAGLLGESESDGGFGEKPESRVDVLRGQTAVSRLEVLDQEVLVCARGGRDGQARARAQAVQALVFGVARILHAAA